MEVTVPTSHTWAADTARTQYNFEGAQYIWQRSWDENDDDSSSSSGGIFSGGGSGDTSGYLALGVFVLCLWLIIEFWWIVIPVAILGGIGWFLKD